MPKIYDLPHEDVYTAEARPSIVYDASSLIDMTVGYMSAIAPRQIIINRPIKHYLGDGNRQITSKMLVSQSMSNSLVPLRNAHDNSEWTLVPFLSQRTAEKRQLAELNNCFADYIGKIRYLEAVNRKLDRDLMHIQKKKGIGMRRIREILVREKREADETFKRMEDDVCSAQDKRQDMEARLKNIEQCLGKMQHVDEIVAVKNAFKQLRETILELEKEIDIIRKTIDDNDDEITLYNNELQRLRMDTSNLTSEIANETTQKHLLLAERAILEQELKALDIAHQFDIEQLRSKVTIANVDPAPFFETQLTAAIRHLRKQFDIVVDQQQQQSQCYYQAKVNTLIEYHQPKRPVESEWQMEKAREITRSIADVRARIQSLQMENDDLDRQMANVCQQIHSTVYQEEQACIDEQQRYQDNIDRLKGYIHDLEQYRTTIEEEIHRYRLLVEGGNHHVGLRHFADEAEKIMNRGRSLLDSLHLHVNKDQFDHQSIGTLREITHSTTYSSGTAHCTRSRSNSSDR
jgi:chromosome segregation ATPase